ncbi:MAG: hypothetical protein WBP56_01530 [Polyangia bacterium]|jgi:hypothetical protein
MARPSLFPGIVLLLVCGSAAAQNMETLGPYGGLSREQKYCSKKFESALDRGEKSGPTTRFTYDKLGRISSMTVERDNSSLSERAIYSYDQPGSYTTETYFGKKTVPDERTKYVLDGKGRVVEVHKGSTGGGGGKHVDKYTYNQHGRAFRMTSTILVPGPGFNNAGKVDVYEHKLVYDQQGNVIELRNLGGIFGRVKRFTYGSDGRPLMMTVSPDGHRVDEIYEYLFDLEGRMVASIGRRPGSRHVPGPVFSLETFTYDAYGNLTTVITILYFRQLSRMTYTYECWPAGKVALMQ